MSDSCVIEVVTVLATVDAYPDQWRVVRYVAVDRPQGLRWERQSINGVDRTIRSRDAAEHWAAEIAQRLGVPFVCFDEAVKFWIRTGCAVEPWLLRTPVVDRRGWAKAND